MIESGVHAGSALRRVLERAGFSLVVAAALSACGSDGGGGGGSGGGATGGASGGGGGATGGTSGNGATGGVGGAAGGGAGGTAGVGATGGVGGAAGGGATGGASGSGGGGATGGAAGSGATGGAGGGTGGSGGSGATGGDAGYSLQFFGYGREDVGRAKIRVDDENTAAPGPPVDVGAEDFTVEFWVKGSTTSNRARAITCSGYEWIHGNIVVDRDRFSQGRAFGISFGAGRVAFGVVNASSQSHTVCSNVVALDGAWHHVAVQRRRSDGRLWVFVDGRKEAEEDGPDGDLSYPDDGVPGNHCGGPCTFSDPFLVLGAEKHDAGSSYPSFRGHLDELRISRSLRYPGDFTPVRAPFATDPFTVGLYRFDEGSGTTAHDTSGAAGGPSDALLRVGGSPVGPAWSTDTPF